MSIQKLNDVWTWFKTFKTTIGSKKSKGDLITLDNEEQIIYEIKSMEHGLHENLQFALVDRMERLFTREKKYTMCKEVIKNMYEFRLSYFGIEHDHNDPSKFEPFDFATDTVCALTKWLLNEFLQDGDFFKISTYSDEKGAYGYYRLYTAGTSPIYINCHENVTKDFGELNIGAYLEHTIYHELTHLLQDVFRCKSGTEVDHEDYGKTWENRWIEREAIYCSNKALSQRLYPLVYSDFENRVISEYTSFDFDKYIETAMFLKELSSFATEFSVSDLKFDNDETELSEYMAA